MLDQEPPERGRRGLPRAVNVLARALHVVAAAVITGAVVVDAGDVAGSPWLWVAVASGLVLLALEVWDAPAFLIELRGLVLGAKLVVLALLPAVDSGAAAAMAMLFFVVVATSHAPASVRHRRVRR